MNMNKNKSLIIIGTVLVVLLIGVTVLLVMEKTTNKELVQEFELERKTWKTNIHASPSSMTN